MNIEKSKSLYSAFTRSSRKSGDARLRHGSSREKSWCFWYAINAIERWSWRYRQRYRHTAAGSHRIELKYNLSKKTLQYSNRKFSIYWLNLVRNKTFYLEKDKQAASEAQMQESIQHINEEISTSTKIEEFNPFRLESKN